MTDEDLRYLASVVEQAKFEYSPLGEALDKELRAKKGNIVFKSKDADLTYDSNHSFSKYKDVNKFKQLSLDSKDQSLQNFYDEFNKLKNLNQELIKQKSRRQKF